MYYKLIVYPDNIIVIAMVIDLSQITDILKFDNSYSWSHPKELFYSVKLLPPGTEIEDSKLVVSGSQSADNPSPCSSRSSPSHDCSDTVDNDDEDIILASDSVESSDAGTGACGVETVSHQTLTASS